jgi:hypothetical protein
MRETSHRSWISITSTGYMESSTNRRNRQKGLVDFFKARKASGWLPHLMTFQFEQLPGRINAILAQMGNDIGRLYCRLVPHVQRFPTTKLGSVNVPILFSCADLPVYKRKKVSLAEATLNDGLHYHGVLLLPPRNRLRTDLATHLEERRQYYLADTRLLTVSAEPIDDNLEKTVGYAFKGMTSGRVHYDDGFLIFPRALSELP